MITRRSFVLSSLAACSTSSFAYPVRQATLIIPFAPGASADGVGRIVAGYLSISLKATVAAENRPGGGGATGLLSVSNGSKDGQVLGLGATGAIAINPHIEGAILTDPLKQLTPISKLIDVPLVLVAKPSSGLTSLQDVVAQSRSLAGGLSFGSTGTNSSQHLSIEVLKQKTGANLVHVPYRGSAPAVTGVLGGQIPLACVDLTAAAEHIKAGTLIGIGVTSTQRYAFAPNIPTFDEQGIAGFNLPGWIGLFGPASLPSDIVSELTQALSQGLRDAAVVAQIERLACAPSFLDSDSFRKFISEQSDLMKQVIASLSRKK